MDDPFAEAARLNFQKSHAEQFAELERKRARERRHWKLPKDSLFDQVRRDTRDLF